MHLQIYIGQQRAYRYKQEWGSWRDFQCKMLPIREQQPADPKQHPNSIINQSIP